MEYIYLIYDGLKFYPKAFSDANLAYDELERIIVECPDGSSSFQSFGRVVRYKVVSNV